MNLRTGALAMRRRHVRHACVLLSRLGDTFLAESRYTGLRMRFSSPMCHPPEAVELCSKSDLVASCGSGRFVLFRDDYTTRSPDFPEVLRLWDVTFTFGAIRLRNTYGLMR